MAALTHRDFVTSVLAEFPDLSGDIASRDGSLHTVMGTFAQYTQAAKSSGDLATYERCTGLADRLFAEADAGLADAFRVSYIEHLEFEGSRGPAAWQLLPARLKAVWNQIAAENRRLMALPQKQAKQKPHKEKSGRERRPPRRRRRR